MRHLFTALAVLTLVACAGGPSVKPGSKNNTASEVPNTLEARSQARWDYLISGDHASAYPLYSPGYRELVTADQFDQAMRRRTVVWHDAVFDEVVGCEDGLCEVVVQVTFEVRSGLPGVDSFESTQVVRERWIEDGDTWYFIPPDR